MRVLHVVRKFPPLIGGDATAVAGLVRAQRRAGDEVHILTYAARGVQDGDAVRVGPPQTGPDLDRVTFRRLRGMAAMRRWAKRSLDALRPEIVHAHAVDVGYAVAPVARVEEIRTVLTCHGVFFPSLGRRSFRGRMEVRLLRLGRYAAVTAVDAASVAALKSVGFSDARLVPNGVDPEEFAGERSHEGPFRFLFAGRLEPEKGVDLLVEAAAQLRERVREPFFVVIAGEGTLGGTIRTRTQELGLEGIVRFPGALGRNEIALAFRASDALILPSRSEGFPVVILEAWAARLPVIAATVGGVPHVCTRETARLVPPEDPDALADAMAFVMQNEDERARLAERGHALARERFAWEAIAREYRKLYASIR